MERITWSTERRKVAELVPADYNPRVITEKERADLAESIREYGEVEPVVVNTDNKLVGGHQRVSIYLEAGIEEIDVRVPSRQLTIEEEMRLNLRLNKNIGGWDVKKLKEMGEDLLLDVGWTDDELRVAFGLDKAGDADLSEERMQVLEVFPPESSTLRERATVKMPTKEVYDKVKAAVESGKISYADILVLADRP